jgi:hypothetical protein
MASVINASVSSNGIVSTADASGVLQLQANGTTVATIQSSGLGLSSNGLVFNDSTTQTSGRGVVKAWVNFSGGSGTINASYGISSVVRNSTGNYTINFSSSFSNSNYVVLTSQQYQCHPYGFNPTTTYYNVYGHANDANGASSDLSFGWFAFLSN